MSPQALAKTHDVPANYYLQPALYLYHNNPAISSGLVIELFHALKRIQDVDFMQLLLLEMGFDMDETGDMSKVPKILSEKIEAPLRAKRPARELDSRGSRPALAHQSLMVTAYTGLAYYALWRTSCQDVILGDAIVSDAELTDAGSDYMPSRERCYDDQVTKDYANQAEIYLGQLRKAAGIWDHFILKLVDLFQRKYDDDDDKVYALLKEYRDLNPNHPNAQLYFYKFLWDRSHSTSDKRMKLDREEITTVLERFCKLVPSHDLCLELARDYLATSEFELCIKLLGTFLEYPMNAHKIGAWKLLKLAIRTSGFGKDNLQGFLDVYLLEKLHFRNKPEGDLAPGVRKLWKVKKSVKKRIL